MAPVRKERRMWRLFEEEFLIRWAYDAGHSWRTTIEERAVTSIITDFAEAYAQRFPSRPPRSEGEIAQKLLQMKGRFDDFMEFCHFGSVQFIGSRPIIRSWGAYLSTVGLPEPPRFRRCRKYGIQCFKKQCFLFDGGYLGVVDLEGPRDYFDN